MSMSNYTSRTKNLNEFVRRTPPSSSSPLVLLLPHSGLEYDAVSHHLDLSREDVRKTVVTGSDHSVPEVIGVRERDDAYIIWTELARAVVDVNRGRTDYDSMSVEGGDIDPKSQGLIWNATIASHPDNIERMLTHPYSHEEFENLMKVGYDPLNLAVKEAMTKAREKYETAVLFDVHSIWANETSTVQKGHHLGAYLVGKPLDPPSLDEKGTPHLYLMTSKDTITEENISCSPELIQYIKNHFRDYGLRVQERQVASPRFQLAHRKYADLAAGYQVFSMEIVGHHGLEKNRAEGELLFEPDPDYLKSLQDAFNEFFIGLRDLKFHKSAR